MLKSKSIVAQKARQRERLQNVLIVKLCWSPAIKEDDTTDHDALLWACVACYNQGRSSFHCLGYPKTNLQLSAGHSWERDPSLKTIRNQLAQFLFHRECHYSNRTRRCTDVRGKRLGGWRGREFRSFSHVLRVCCRHACKAIVDKIESGAVTAVLKISLSSRSIVAHIRLLPF